MKNHHSPFSMQYHSTEKSRFDQLSNGGTLLPHTPTHAHCTLFTTLSHLKESLARTIKKEFVFNIVFYFSAHTTSDYAQFQNLPTILYVYHRILPAVHSPPFLCEEAAVVGEGCRAGSDDIRR